MSIGTKTHFCNSSSPILTPCLPGKGGRGPSDFARGVFALDSKDRTIGAEKLLSFAEYLCINYYGKMMDRPKIMTCKTPGQLSSSAAPETRRERPISGRIAYPMTATVV